MALVVIEGIDGAGKTTFLKRFIEFVSSTHPSLKIQFYHYPDYDSIIGKLIKSYLDAKIQLNPWALTLLYLADMKQSEEKLRLGSQDGLVILDRYFYSTVAYQGVQLKDPERIKALIELLGFPRPDVVVLLDYPPEKAVQRTSEDRFSRQEFLARVRQLYLQLARENFYAGEWIVVNAEDLEIPEKERETFRRVLDLIRTAGLPEH